MPSNAIDYEAVMADLEAKRTAFNGAVDAAIANLRYVLAVVNGSAGIPLAPPAIQGTGAVTPPATGTLTPDAFFGLSIAEAAIKYLTTVKRQQTTRDITDALVKAGYHHTSQNFLNTVNTALYRREREEGDVVKIARNWALTEWYPGRRKSPKKGESSVVEPPDDFIVDEEVEPVPSEESK